MSRPLGSSAVPSPSKDESVTDTFEAFLSYTRLDNEFFGGAVTSLRAAA